MASTTKPPHVPVDPLAPEEAPTETDASTEAPRRPWVRGVFAALALVFFLGPGLIILSGRGGRALPREQHAATPRPSQGWRFFFSATRYLTQRLPLRDRALDANTWISENVFGATPFYGKGAGPDQALPFGGVREANANGGYAQTGGARGVHPVAAVGRDGWIFLQGELDSACDPPVGFETAVRRWDRFLRGVRATGRSVVLMVAPEKSTIYPEHVAPKTISWTCAWPQKQRLWSDIEAMRNPDVVPLRQQLLAMKRRDPGQLLYLPLDSHWNDVGALELTRDALDHVGRGVRVAPGEVRSGTKRYKGDIAAFAGEADKTGEAPTRTMARASDARSIPGTTLFLHDSYGDAVVPLLRPYATRLTVASFIGTDRAQILRLLRRSRTVIVETVERDFLKRAAAGLNESVLTPQFLRAVRGQLGPPPPAGP